MNIFFKVQSFQFCLHELLETALCKIDCIHVLFYVEIDTKKKMCFYIGIG